ncbi:MAG: type II toxin-antitoxin system VapC family toxin [Pseudomonadota bacterium]
MPFVLDCSVTMAWMFRDEATDRTEALRDALVTELAVVPELWPIEVANVLLVATRRGRLAEDDWRRIFADLGALPIEVDPSTSNRALQILDLAHRHGISAYDAAYLELALRMQLPLATLDRKLAAACRSAGVAVVT